MIQNSFCAAALVALDVIALDLAHDARLQMAVFRLDIVERAHRLDDVRIGIDRPHNSP